MKQICSLNDLNPVHINKDGFEMVLLSAKEYEKIEAIYERAKIVTMLHESAENRQNGMECIPAEEVFMKIREKNAKRI